MGIFLISVSKISFYNIEYLLIENTLQNGPMSREYYWKTPISNYGQSGSNMAILMISSNER